VLAVDRQEQPSSAPLRLERELPGGDKAFLVRQREVDPVLERPQGRRQPGESDDGVEHEVRLGALEQPRQVAPDLRERRQAVDGLRAGGGGTQLQLGVPGDDLERLAPDRACGAQ
jgi:hypothetical protein